MYNNQNLLKQKPQKDMRKLQNSTLIKNEKSSNKALNTSTPYVNKEKQNPGSPLDKSSQAKNAFNHQNLINQIQPLSTKNPKNFLHFSKILNPKKNDFLKQYLNNQISQKKPNLKLEVEISNTHTQNIKNYIEKENKMQFNSETPNSRVEVNNQQNQRSRPSSVNKTVLLDKSNMANYFISPKNAQSTKAAKTVFNFSKDFTKENLMMRNIVDSRDYGSAKISSKKSTENLAYIAANNQVAEESSKPIFQPKGLAELDNSMNFSPIKPVKFTTTTNAKVQNEIRQTRANGSDSKPNWEEKHKQRIFKFNEEGIAQNNIEVEDLSPIKPLKYKAETGGNQIHQSNPDLRERDHSLKDKKQTANQPYPTLIKQINLITSNTPTSMGKPPLHNHFSLTPQNNNESGTKLNFENFKNNMNLNIHSVKENKKFEFPAYLNNYTCEGKRKGDNSFNIEVYNQRYLKDKNQKFSFQNFNNTSLNGQQKTSKLENTSRDTKDLKLDDGLGDSPKVLKGLKNSPNMMRYSSRSSTPTLTDLGQSKTPKNCGGNSFSDSNYNKMMQNNVINAPNINNRKPENYQPPVDLKLGVLKDKNDYMFKDRNIINFSSDKENNMMNLTDAFERAQNMIRNPSGNHNNANNENAYGKKSALHDSRKEESSQNSNSLKDVNILDQDPSEKETKQARFREEYIIGKQIGQGAYATVRLAIHKPKNLKVAIKIYEKQKIMDPMRRKSVKREIKLMQKMDHPNIIKIHDTFETSNHVNIIMEYVGGSSLHSHLKAQQNRRLKEENAYKLFKQVCAGISYCHSRCITHRDIKLENLLMDENGVLKIIDFGFSTCIPNDKRVKMFCGTPSYMAPEIVLKKEYCGPPADVWALGVLLYALLCGTFPFKGATDKELYKKIVKGEFLIPEFVSETATSLIRKMLTVDADKRPTAKEIFNDPWVVHHVMLEKKEALEKQQALHRKNTSNEKLNQDKYEVSGKNPIGVNTSSSNLNSSNFNYKAETNGGGTVHVNNYLKHYVNASTPTNGQNKFFSNSQFENAQKASTKNLSPNTTILKTAQTPTNNGQTNNFFINNKNIIYNINIKDNEQQCANSGVKNPNDTDTTQDEIEDPKGKTNKHSLNETAPLNNKSNSNFNIQATETKPSKRYENGRTSLNTNIFGLSNTAMKKEANHNNADMEIVNNLIKLGYQEDEIYQSLREKTGLIYSLYVKGVNEKKNGMSYNASTLHNVNTSGIINTSSQYYQPFPYASPSNMGTLKKFNDTNAGYAVGYNGKSCTYLDMSGITNKDSSFLAETMGRNSLNNHKEINVSDTDIVVKLSNPNLHNN